MRRATVVAILCPRQAGKTTLARELARGRKGAVTRFDLEDPQDASPELLRQGSESLAGRIHYHERGNVVGAFRARRHLTSIFTYSRKYTRVFSPAGESAGAA